jgi:hypothetical protein
MDRQAAQRWCRAAAELGHGHAQPMLGKYLLVGLRVISMPQSTGPSRKALPMWRPNLRAQISQRGNPNGFERVRCEISHLFASTGAQ